MHYCVVAPGDGWLSVQKEDVKLQEWHANTEVNNSRYVHVGNVSHGCVTVVDLEQWAEVYEYLIKHRLPGGQHVGKLVVRP